MSQFAVEIPPVERFSRAELCSALLQPVWVAVGGCSTTGRGQGREEMGRRRQLQLENRTEGPGGKKNF